MALTRVGIPTAESHQRVMPPKRALGVHGAPASFPYPEGIPSPSEGLRGTSYPGTDADNLIYPNGVASGKGRNPVGVETLAAVSTRVGRRYAAYQPFARGRYPFGIGDGAIAFTTPKAPALGGAPSAPRASFVASGDRFLLNGKPFVIRSGEMHYPRVPRAYWRDRMRKAKAMGLNTICTYVFWSLHEPKPGKFDFSGNLDLAAYIRTAQQEGLYVIVRPGPYICTEFDFGGLPAWLQKDRSMVVRSKDPKFLRYTQRYFDKVGKLLKPLLIQNGGPIILTQVENEYGSYGADHVYMGAVRDALIHAGFSGQLFTSDGPGQGMLSGGTLPGIPAAVNFGGGGESAIAELKRFRPDAPKMVGEYWCGWFDHWGERHHRTAAAPHAKDIEWFIKNDVSFNLYMFHGGTSFGFMAGANGDKNSYQPDVTSYDYDSPLDESGRVTEKYRVFRDTIARGSGETLPPVPASPAPIALPTFKLRYDFNLDNRPASRVVESTAPKTFEELGQSGGMVIYSAQTKLSGPQVLEVQGLHDFAVVSVNGKVAGTLDRRTSSPRLSLVLPSNGSTIELAVEMHARINFGHELANEREGIVGKVLLGEQELQNWSQAAYPLTEAPKTFSWGGAGTPRSPLIYRGEFSVSHPGDTFLDLGNWTKGYVWVNGHNLGRYWTAAGPQRTLYLPGCWMKPGSNEVVIIDEGPLQKVPTLVGLDHAILDARPTAGLRPIRKPGQTVDLTRQTVAAQGEFTPKVMWQSVKLPEDDVRYVAFEVLSEHGQGPFASAAEIELIGLDDKPIKGVHVVYADSEELDNENGSAANVVDGQPTTMWHTQWGDAQPKPPHLLVLDLGTITQIKALRYLPRADAPNGRVKAYRIYMSTMGLAVGG
ncbi:beta-galactosidase [Fimbriimonas ginsengisoli]|uniref:Beta-galactosidase n=1 Tax=Fimbriimonas ginsengisoli Gsoil 348 TaxID=661478 RepID=A0A068NRA6_FIMGI|nr:beta-galactosidase [Fimbriimonas ginsengisoli]AIE85305.1 Beta-galactosidase [Fimbriimonas ginsengisoli Gsoil 348]